MRRLLGCPWQLARWLQARLWRANSAQTVSRACLRDLARQEASRGTDGPVWRQWPVQTAVNNSALFNTYRLRKKA